MKEVKTKATMEFFEAANNHLCPNCRNIMAPVDSVRENGISFVWYECMDPNCGGQWLEKKVISKKGA